MSPVKEFPPILVTGGSGFIASALIAALLNSGQTVHATVRSLSNKEKTAPLVRLQGQHPNQLYLFEADLLIPGSFDTAMANCVIVHHVASPFRMPERIRDGEAEMLKPALEGTRNVLDSVNRTASVRRVVLTSTIGAIFGSYIDVITKMEGAVLREQYWNESSSTTKEPYHYSKAMAEKEAWKIWDAQREAKRWDLVAINPGLVLGPSLVPASESGSLFLIDELMAGQLWFGVPDISFATVDVRDVVTAHIAAAERSAAHGRYIIAEKDMTRFVDLAKGLREHAVGVRKILMPTWQIPTWFLRIVGPMFGLDNEFIREHVGVRFTIDNERSVQELSVKYRPLEMTLKDHYTAWLAARK